MSGFCFGEQFVLGSHFVQIENRVCTLVRPPQKASNENILCPLRVARARQENEPALRFWHAGTSIYLYTFGVHTKQVLQHRTNAAGSKASKFQISTL